MTAALSPGTKLVGADGKAISAEGIRPGQLVELTHSGVVQTIYPSVYPDVYKVRVLGDAEAELYALAQARKEEWDAQFAQMAE